MMLSYEMTIAYYKAFGSFPFMREPSGGIAVEDSEGNAYEIDMTPEEFMQTIIDSQEAGRNLFFERGKLIEIKDNILL